MGKSLKDEEDSSYWVITGGSDVEVEEIATEEDLVAHLKRKQDEAKEFCQTSAKVVVVSGIRCYLTKGINKHIELPSGTRLPLFDDSKSELDFEGDLVEQPVKRERNSSTDTELGTRTPGGEFNFEDEDADDDG